MVALEPKAKLFTVGGWMCLVALRLWNERGLGFPVTVDLLTLCR